MHAVTPRPYIFQMLFQLKLFVITPTLKAGSRCSRHVSHGNTLIVFLNILHNETLTLLNT